ncbi:MAG: hypothetical protein JXQ84_05295 [Rhodospirillaceae bacterium]|nr:hypothetical protein [Rhodospirillaceae bacterium]
MFRDGQASKLERRPGLEGNEVTQILVERRIGRTGHYQPLKDGPSGYVSNSPDEAIRGFQGDNSLNVDGVLNPGGPTISTLEKAVGGRWKPSPAVKTLNLPEDFLGGTIDNEENKTNGDVILRDAFWRNEEHPGPVKPTLLSARPGPDDEPLRPTPSASFGEGSLLGFGTSAVP